MMHRDNDRLIARRGAARAAGRGSDSRDRYPPRDRGAKR
jgi:hypothetical protein